MKVKVTNRKRRTLLNNLTIIRSPGSRDKGGWVGEPGAKKYKEGKTYSGEKAARNEGG